MPTERPYFSSLGAPLPENESMVHLGLFAAPQLETPRFDSLPFSHTVSILFEDIMHSEEDRKYFSSIDLSCSTEKYTRIRDAIPEWEGDPEDDDFFTGDFLETLRSNISPQCDNTSTRLHNAAPSQPDATSHGQDVLSLSDFLFDPTSSGERTENCIRRSDGRPYAIRKVLQTRQAWTELAILELIKDARVGFSPLSYGAFERDHYIYLILEDYPGCTLAEAVTRHGVFGTLEIFFYACEIIAGLRSLHDAGIIHCNVSPDNIIFDKQGHIVLSGVEHGTLIRPHRKGLHHPIASGTGKYYQAPELLLGWSYDTLVDSWSFGLVMCFMFRGKHAFMSVEGGEGNPDPCDFTNKTFSDRIFSTMVKFINPIARDLILRCLEHNPVMRLDARSIQNHPYFSNADWERVLKKAIEAPSRSRELFASSIPPQGPIGSDQDSQNYPSIVFSGHQTCSVKTWSQPPRTSGDGDKHQLPLVGLGSEHLGKKLDGNHMDENHRGSAPADPDMSQDLSNFWDSLDRERSSLRSDNSILSNMKIPFSSAWSLCKERSFVFPRRLFPLNPTSVKQKLRRKTKSVSTLKYSAYAKPITDLPSGLSQIGSGIGFTYNVPAVAPASIRNSMASDCTAVPNACQGLLHGLGMSSFWSGPRSASTVDVDVSSTPVCDVTQESQAQDISADDDYVDDSSPAHVSHDPMEGEVCTACAGAETPVLYTLPALPKRSATSLSVIQEITSPTGSAVTASTEDEEILTPDTAAYQPGESATVELKGSEETYGLDPESTLRLVTPATGLRLSWAVAEPFQF